jgi:hypothetical protein
MRSPVASTAHRSRALSKVVASDDNARRRSPPNMNRSQFARASVGVVFA